MRPAAAAIGRGLAIALAIAVPAVLAAQVVDALTDGDAGWIGYPLSLVVLAGVATGGRITARTAPEHPIAFGAATGFIAIVVVQVLGVVRRSAAQRDIAWHTTPAVTATAVMLAIAAAALTAGRPGRTRP